MSYIVEVEQFGDHPSLFALEWKLVAEVSERRAGRFSIEEARRIAKEEKRVRPKHRILIRKAPSSIIKRRST